MMQIITLRVVVQATLVGACLVMQAAPAPVQDLHPGTPDAKQAETPNATAVPTFKETVRRVILDVVVTDRATRKPVHGLTQKDFEIEEDGRPQEVLSFEEHDLDSDKEFLAAVPTLPPNTFINVAAGAERGPLYVLLLDLVNTAVEDQPYARAQLLKFIKAKPEGTRFAVFVITDKVQLVQGFTSDKNRLVATLDPKSPQPHLPSIFLYGDNYGRGQSNTMVDIFERLAHYLDGMPGRKNLVWFAGEFPFSIFPSTDDAQSYQDEVKDTLDTMARNQIALYTVDATALPVTVAHAPADDTGGSGVSDSRTSGQYMVEDAITQATGGHAYYSTNDLAGALEQATETGGSYYTFMYSPSNRDYDGRLRNIKVKVEMRGYGLAYRRSYYGADPDTAGKERASGHVDAGDKAVVAALEKSLAANIQHGAPMEHQILLRATLHAAGVPAMATPEQMAAWRNSPPSSIHIKGKHRRSRCLR
jgi:VWFA-related protein